MISRTQLLEQSGLSSEKWRREPLEGTSGLCEKEHVYESRDNHSLPPPPMLLQSPRRSSARLGGEYIYTDGDGPQQEKPEHTADDPLEPLRLPPLAKISDFWKRYDRLADIHDKKLTSNLNANLDVLLIFVI